MVPRAAAPRAPSGTAEDEQSPRFPLPTVPPLIRTMSAVTMGRGANHDADPAAIEGERVAAGGTIPGAGEGRETAIRPFP